MQAVLATRPPESPLYGSTCHTLMTKPGCGLSIKFYQPVTGYYAHTVCTRVRLLCIFGGWVLTSQRCRLALHGTLASTEQVGCHYAGAVQVT
jgi:hypothetical protein